MSPDHRNALLLVAFVALIAGVTCITQEYQRVYNLGTRDVAYSSKFVDNDRIIVTGPSTSPIVGGTGTDFFALCVLKEDGTPCSGFGTNGIVRVDFDNVGGSSRTDVATELLYIPRRASLAACPGGCVALLGVAVVSPTGQATNLTFAIAMIDATTGELKTQFGNGGKALYDIDKGVNDEIFFGAVSYDNMNDDDERDPTTPPHLLVGGFVNPTNTTGAAASFNCGVLKVDSVTGQRITSWGQNGQVIIDFNGYDERCRSGLIFEDRLIVGGRSRPAAQSHDPSDANNFRATLAVLHVKSGMFDASYGPSESPFGLGRSLVNLNNGSFDLIKTAIDPGNKHLYSIGNWGGWDNGVSGNKAVGIIRWSTNGNGGLDKHWSRGGIAHVAPCKAGRSYDVYDFAFHRHYVYVVGGVRSSASSTSPPTAVLMRFSVYNGAFDEHFGLKTHRSIVGATSSLYRSIIIDGNDAFLAGEVGFGVNEFDVLLVSYRL